MMEPLNSLGFSSEKSNTAQVVILTIVFVLIIIAIFIIAINLAAKRTTPCDIAPNPPENILIQQISSSAFTISWDSIPTASLYTAYIGLSPGFTRTQSILIETSSQNFIGISGLTPNNLYYIVITSANACGESDNSTEIAFNFI